MEKLSARLVDELKTLRKGRGIFGPGIDQRIGPALRETIGIADSDGPAEIRHKVAERLESLASGLPEDLRVAVLAAFGIARDARLPFYQDRVQWAAERLGRDVRTARRRIDEGIDRIAEIAATSTTQKRPLELATGKWYTQRLRIYVVLDQPIPEVFEFRRIVATHDLYKLDLASTMAPRPHTGHQFGSTSAAKVGVDVFYGGTLVQKPTADSPDRLGLSLVLPQQLRRHEIHEFALRYWIPADQIQPHLVCIPPGRCDLLELRIRFDQDHPPQRVWSLADAFQRDVDDPEKIGREVQLDAVGEVRSLYRQLIPDRAYGFSWTHGASTRSSLP